MAKTIDLLESLATDITKLEQSGDLDLPTLGNSNIIRYNTFTERLQTIELFRYLVIINYGNPETYFKKKIVKIYKEINCLQTEPIITTISNSENYYWALPTYNIIAVPSGEEKNLLNLPDMYHEIGHLLDKQHRTDLIGSFIQKLDKFYKDEEQRVIDEQRDARLVGFYREKHANWINGWIMEFICDFIATYLVGPAYAYTNLKLSTLSSGKDRLYADFPSHPSDESRMRAIFYMLGLLGFDQEVITINNSWKVFLNNTNNPIPTFYSYVFPQQLIQQLGDEVFKGCSVIDLRSYPDQVKQFTLPISKILNEAWTEVMNNTSGYKVWEEQKIKDIANLI